MLPGIPRYIQAQFLLNCNVYVYAHSTHQERKREGEGTFPGSISFILCASCQKKGGGVYGEFSISPVSGGRDVMLLDLLCMWSYNHLCCSYLPNWSNKSEL